MAGVGATPGVVGGQASAALPDDAVVSQLSPQGSLALGGLEEQGIRPGEGGFCVRGSRFQSSRENPFAF